MSTPARLVLQLVTAVYLVFFAVTGGGCYVPQSQNVQGKSLDVTEPITERNYYLYLPKNFNPRSGVRYPLIVSIHGMKPFDNAYPQLMTWKKICDEHNWVAIAPQLKSPDMLNQFPFRRIDDSIYSDERQIVASIEDVCRRYNADPTKVMLTGWSSGGFLIHYCGARHPELFSVVVPQGSNFSADIMPDTVNQAARETPIYIYHGESDVGVVVKDSNTAIQWYYQHGYRFVQMDTAPGGHERHPELAEKFFLGYIRGTNVYTLADRGVTFAKQNALSDPWLGQPIGPVGTPVATGPRLTGVGPSPSPTDVTPTPTPTPAPAGQPPLITTGGNDTTPQPPGPAVASVDSTPPKYVWNKIGPTRTPGPEQTPTPTPTPTPGPTAVASSGWNTSPRPNNVTDAPPTGGPSTADITPVPIPIGPGPTNVAGTGPGAIGPRPTVGGVGDVAHATPPSGVTGEGPRPVITDTPAIGPSLPTPTGPTRPVATDANPAGGLAPDTGMTPQPTPIATTPPQVVPVAPNRTGVRIVPSVTQGTAPLTVEFRAEVRNIGSQVTRFRWRLDDILFSTSHFAVLTFQRPGRFPIEVTLYDAAGNAYRDRVVIRVFPAAEGGN
ncbi:MAG: hypothetical protein BIFFINMI_01552 [Phycisphaerae bacterium]|nr:hypothetical protein [Phycisphaerae bacterium]